MNEKNWARRTFFLILMLVGALLFLYMVAMNSQFTQNREIEKSRICSGHVTYMDGDFVCMSYEGVYVVNLTPAPWWMPVNFLGAILLLMSPLLYIVFKE